MPRILYNEGRVVGYSAYEEYVRQALQQDPNSTPATEKEWLASTISIGSSMLLHIQPDEANSLIRDFKLPETSRLFAANTIIGSFFEGKGHNPTDSPWCDYVESYGNLISNTSGAHPTTDATTYPNTEDSEEYKQKVDNQIKQYLKIKDGVVIKEGTWTDSTKIPPAEVLTSTNNNPPIVRLSFESKIDTDFYILLSGFTDKAVIKGVTNIENQTETQSPQNGDFLGPAVFPWANKIIFTLSSRQDEIIKSNTLGDIKAGIGIDIDKNDDGSITINNSAPNWDNAKYTKIQPACSPNGIYTMLTFNGWNTGTRYYLDTAFDKDSSVAKVDALNFQMNVSRNEKNEILSLSIKNVNTLDVPAFEANPGNVISNTWNRLFNPTPIKVDDRDQGIGIKHAHDYDDRLGSYGNYSYYAYESVIFSLSLPLEYRNFILGKSFVTTRNTNIFNFVGYNSYNNGLNTKADQLGVPGLVYNDLEDKPKYIGMSWEYIVSPYVLTSTIISDAKTRYDNATDKEHTFYKQIICGNNEEVSPILSPGDILFCIDSIGDGYNDQVFSSNYSTQLSKMVLSADPPKVLYCQSANLGITVTFSR